MRYDRNLFWVSVFVCGGAMLVQAAQKDFAPAVPDLNLPIEEEVVQKKVIKDIPSLDAEPAPVPVVATPPAKSARPVRANKKAISAAKQPSKPVAPVVAEEPKPLDTPQASANEAFGSQPEPPVQWDVYRDNGFPWVDGNRNPIS